jgi:hypothetical protein
MFDKSKLASAILAAGVSALVVDTMRARRYNRLVRKLIEIDNENDLLREELQRTCKQYNYLCDILCENEIPMTEFDHIVLTTNLL